MFALLAKHNIQLGELNVLTSENIELATVLAEGDAARTSVFYSNKSLMSKLGENAKNYRLKHVILVGEQMDSDAEEAFKKEYAENPNVVELRRVPKMQMQIEINLAHSDQVTQLTT